MMTSSPVSCPICQRPADARLRPFCSSRCADIDLGRWFGGDYRVPGAPLDPMQPDLPQDQAANPAVKSSGRVDPGEGLG